MTKFVRSNIFGQCVHGVHIACRRIPEFFCLIQVAFATYFRQLFQAKFILKITLHNCEKIRIKKIRRRTDGRAARARLDHLDADEFDLLRLVFWEADPVVLGRAEKRPAVYHHFVVWQAI